MKKTILALLTLLLTLALASCGSAPTGSAEPVNIAFVLGIADGENRLRDGIAELAALPAQTGTTYAFISAEGVPVPIGEPGTIPDLSDRGYTEVMLRRVHAGIEADLMGRLDAYSPRAAEIDMAAATSLAVRTLRANAREGRSNVLVFYCSGRSTTGLINMAATPLYRLDIDASVPVIAEKMKVDMSCVDQLIWYCCGEAGGSQPALSAEETAKMKDFYRALFAALGMDASDIHFRDDLPSADYYRFDVPVTSMAVEGTASGLRTLAAPEPVVMASADVEITPEAPIVLPESMVRFKPDSADFLDPDAAREAIAPVAELLLAHPELQLLLYGTCAGDSGSEATLRLGQARAASVREALIDAGVDGGRITTVPVQPTDDPYYRFGLGTGEEASVNRKTVILDRSSDQAQQILSKGGTFHA